MTISADPQVRLQHLPWSLRMSAHSAAASLWLEQFLQATAKPLLALIGYMALGLTGGIAQLPGVIRVAVLATLLVWTGVCALRAIARIRAADVRSQLRRLEQAAQLPAGRLLLHVDAPQDGNSDHPFWRRATAQLPQLTSLPWPRLSLLWQQPPGVAALLLLALFAAPLIGGHRSFGHLQQAFSPWPTSLADVQISAVVRPPRYTDLPPQPLLLRAGSTLVANAVAGSDLLITVTGTRGALALADVPLQLQRDGSSYAAIVPLKKPGLYKLKNGWRTIGAVDVRLRVDGAPQLFFTAKPKTTNSKSLDISYRYADDYGFASLAVVATDGRFADAQLLPKPQGAQGSAQAWRDFTPGRFAGKAVQLYLVGFDALVPAPARLLPLCCPSGCLCTLLRSRLLACAKGCLRQARIFAASAPGLRKLPVVQTAMMAILRCLRRCA
jgi:hypothetical protein